jgi:hypothetical protein
MISPKPCHLSISISEVEVYISGRPGQREQEEVGMESLAWVVVGTGSRAAKGLERSWRARWKHDPLLITAQLAIRVTANSKHLEQRHRYFEFSG